jgi:hypothetical protein
VNVSMPFNIPNSLTWARIALIRFSSASTTCRPTSSRPRARTSSPP